MDRSRVVKLIKVERTKDRYGMTIKNETAREVYAAVHSVSANEIAQAGVNGVKPEISISMFAYDYDKEEIFEVDGVRYSVYRTYFSRNDTLELYAERKYGNA